MDISSEAKRSLEDAAQAWVQYWLAARDAASREAFAWASGFAIDLALDNAFEDLWTLVLLIHCNDQSASIQPVLAAGPLEDLLAGDGDNRIVRVEQLAKEDRSFAKLLGGVWKSSMSDTMWARVQAVWDRRGWDGIPE